MSISLIEQQASKRQAAPAAPLAWQPTEAKGASFDSNAVIDAYLVGKHDGFNHGMGEMQRATVELLRNNADKAAAATATLLDALRQQGIVPIGSYLKVLSWDELSVLVLVEEAFFLQPTFKQIYDVVYQLEEANEQANLTLTFGFAPFGEHFSMTCMSADGYSLRFQDHTPSEATVPAPAQ